MGSGISLPSIFFTKRLRLNVEQYKSGGEAPGIRERKTFGWSKKIEIKNKLRSPGETQQ